MLPLHQPASFLATSGQATTTLALPAFDLPCMPVRQPSKGRQHTHSRHHADVHLHGPQQVTVTMSGPDAADRAELQGYIHQIFKRAYGADVRDFMPQLLSLRDAHGDLLAVCGLRHADSTPLFLERYLDRPVQQALALATGQQVPREQLIEIGNLAVGEPSSSRCLLAAISLYLHGTDTRWAVFTGISALRNSLTKLNMQLHPLGTASIERLPAHERAAWGSYYQQKPLVMAIQRQQPLLNDEVQ
ncbi:thermostable hemolysin [Methylobacillus flagellatus]|uniref:thermostable hemolysin n=1 Tax=Methylobacillus flagellatus TaxID=405 RepID=UPI0010F74A27|nr:thermostable hemolysin [Methylobacillus flagellatus]